LAVNEPGPFGEGFPFETDCDSELLQSDVDFTLDLRQVRTQASQSQQGIFMALLHLDGGALDAWQMRSPGVPIQSLGAPDGFYSSNGSVLKGFLPILLPASPEHTSYVVADAVNALAFTTPSDAVCAYFIPVRDEGSVLDLNLIAVGNVAMSLDPLAENTQLGQMLAAANEILVANGFELGLINFHRASAEVAERYAIVRSSDEVQELVATSRSPGETIDERLSLNLFLVEDMAFPSGIVVGASSGMPGAAGLHGFPGTGVVVSMANVSSEPSLVARTMVHEIGHFLGLGHTTEVNGQSHEPIHDTPDCGPTIMAYPEGCEDASNLMFPYSLGDNVYLTEGQRFVLRMNPLTKTPDL
jgi:hypothetical protein